VKNPACLLLLAAGLVLTGAAPQNLPAARQNAAVLADQSAAADARLRADTARAAVLAEREVAAAIALRRLENDTGAAAARLAALQAEAVTAQAALAAGAAQLETLLPVMERLSAQPAATLFAAPGPPADAIRGVLILQGIAAEISRKAAAVAAQQASVAALLRDSTAQQAILTQAVARQRAAEAALSGQIASAKAAEMADSDRAISAAAAALAANQQVGTMQGAIARLAAARPGATANPEQHPAARGAPVAGAIAQNFGDDTPAGPAEGVSYRAAPGARVAAPCAGPVLFADHFHGYGLLVILDCGGGDDFVLSGMARLDVAAGQQLAAGQPVGEMPPYDPKHPTRQPLLYVELRHGGVAVDPAVWLGAGGSG